MAVSHEAKPKPISNTELAGTWEYQLLRQKRETQAVSSVSPLEHEPHSQARSSSSHWSASSLGCAISQRFYELKQRTCLGTTYSLPPQPPHFFRNQSTGKVGQWYLSLLWELGVTCIIPIIRSSKGNPSAEEIHMSFYNVRQTDSIVTLALAPPSPRLKTQVQLITKSSRLEKISKIIKATINPEPLFTMKP